MQLSVFDLGHTGAVVAGCLVSRGHDVIAVDGDAGKLDLVRRGIAPVGGEPGLDGLIRKAVESGRLTTTAQVAEAIENTALSSICTPAEAPPRNIGDLAEIIALCERIGAALAAKSKFHSIVLRTALPAGATRGRLIPVLERASGKRAGTGFGVAVYPACLRRGTAIEDCLNPPAILLGVTDDETLARVREMEIAIQAPEMIVDLAEAEATAPPHRRRATATTEQRPASLPSGALAADGLSW